VPKTIKIALNPQSVDRAIRELESYRDSLSKKADAIAHGLAELGYTVAAGILSQHIFDGDTFGSLTVESKGEGKYILYAQSKAILFVEFGVGARAGNNPLGAELGMGAGTYPNQKHALDPNGWWFPTDDARLIVRTDSNGQGWGHSYGYPARMPFAMASESMKRDLLKVAKEVFASG